MSRIVVFGAGGRAGTRAVAEAAGRGHEVTAVVRDPGKYADLGGDRVAVVAGDVAMRAEEVTPVLKALRSHGIEIVAIHHHMTATDPAVYFLHYWGKGPAQKLATAVRAALDQTRQATPGKR